MSLEDAILKLTAAVEANTAALKAGGSAPAATGKAAKEPKTETKTEAAYTPKHDKSKMTAALNEVKEKFDAATAKGIIKNVGGAEKMAEINDPQKIDETYEAAIKKLAEKKDDDM